MTPSRLKIYRTLLIPGVFFLSSCASLPPPTTQLNAADAAVVEAREVRADQLAPEQLRAAQNRLAAAKEMMAGKDYELARQLAEQAEADAELAVALSRVAAWRTEVERKTEQNALLRRNLLGESRR